MNFKQVVFIGALAALGTGIMLAPSCNKPNGEKPEENTNGTDTTTVITPVDTCLTMPHFNKTYYMDLNDLNTFPIPHETIIKETASCLIDTIFYRSNADLTGWNVVNMDWVLAEIKKEFAISHKLHGGYSVLNPTTIYADTKTELEKLGFVVNATAIERPTANAAVKRKSEQYFAMCDARNFPPFG